MEMLELDVEERSQQSSFLDDMDESKILREAAGRGVAPMLDNLANDSSMGKHLDHS